MNSIQRKTFAFAILATGLALAPTADARSIAAWSGSPINSSDSACFTESYASTNGACYGAARPWEMPLPVDSGGPFTVTINVTPNGTNLQSVGCQVATLNQDSTQYWTSWTSGVSYPTTASTAQNLTFGPAPVPAGGTLYAACWLEVAGRINSVNWD